MTATAPQPSKVTYTSANVDWELFHRQFDEALARVRAQLGQDYPLYIGRDAVPSGGPPIVDASPIDTSMMLGRFATATPEQEASGNSPAGTPANSPSIMRSYEHKTENQSRPHP